MTAAANSSPINTQIFITPVAHNAPLINNSGTPGKKNNASIPVSQKTVVNSARYTNEPYWAVMRCRVLSRCNIACKRSKEHPYMKYLVMLLAMLTIQQAVIVRRLEHGGDSFRQHVRIIFAVMQAATFVARHCAFNDKLGHLQ